MKVNYKASTAVNFIPDRVKVHYKALTTVNFIPHCVKLVNKALESEEEPRSRSPQKYHSQHTSQIPHGSPIKQGPRK